MKYTYYLLLLPFFCFALSACSDKDDSKDGGDDERPETLAWIEDKLRDRYYWDDKIPAKPNYNTETEDFFKSLLYKAEDGKDRGAGHYYYSTINKVSDKTRSLNEKYTYGFDFTTVTISNTGEIVALVLYVIPGTPAAEAGLRRGDWIVAINEKALTDNNIGVLYGDKKNTFTINKWSANQKKFIFDRTVTIEAAQPLEVNPVFLATTINRAGKKVGYLAYNSFKAGLSNNDNDKTYDNLLRELSGSTFNGVNEFVLDLRYNGGGLLTSTQLLCGILGPVGVLSDKKFGYLEYNDKSTAYFSAGSKEGNGTNLNLSRLFVLVSAYTASASEAVINLLTPYMEVVVIGRTTEGKNMGSNTFTSDDKVWEIHPITSKIFNSKGKSDYANGLAPTIMKGDVFDYDNEGYVTPQEYLYDLGDPNERLLKIALEEIDGLRGRSSYTVGTSTRTFIEGESSLNRKAYNSVIID